MGVPNFSELNLRATIPKLLTCKLSLTHYSAFRLAVFFSFSETEALKQVKIRDYKMILIKSHCDEKILAILPETFPREFPIFLKFYIWIYNM